MIGVRLLPLAFVAFLGGSLHARSEGVRIQATQNAFACRDINDAVRLGLRQLDGDKQGFLAVYNAKQDTGGCQPLRQGALGTLEDVHDEPNLHLVCIRQVGDDACFWAINPRFGPAPY